MHYQWEPATDPQGQGDLEKGCIVWRMDIKMLPGGGAKTKLSLPSWVENLKNQDLEPKTGEDSSGTRKLRAVWTYSLINR